MTTVDWNVFLTDEGLTPNEQWNEFAQSTADSLSAMSKPTSGPKPGLGAEDLTGFGPLYNSTNFDAALFNANDYNDYNDYFLSDQETLLPFGDILAGDTTSESSPEPTSGISQRGPFSQSKTTSSTNTHSSTPMRFDQSSRMLDVQRPSVQRAQTFPAPSYEAMFPNGIDSGFVENLTFSTGQDVSLRTSKSDVDNGTKAIRDPTQKRNKNKPDILSACWSSPLCPNHDQDGPPPNPSTCGSGCAPFLFAEQTPSSTLRNNIPEPQEVVAEDGVVEIQPRRKKRSESDSAFTAPTARGVLSSLNINDEEDRSRMKSESSQDSPVQVQPSTESTEDGKPKSRRRLPHNQVERKYRESLNTQLESLRKVVPALQQNPRVCDGADIEDLPAPSKPSKAVILASATAYIKQMEKDNKIMQEENELLRAKMKTLQAPCDDCSIGYLRMQYVNNLKISQQT